MLKISLIAGAVGSAAGLQVGMGARTTAVRAASPSMASLYDFSGTTLDGKSASMSDFKGKPVLILNVASL